MSNEKTLNSDLGLEEKLVVATVLLLASLFLWQFWENEEKVVQVFNSDTEEEIINTQSFFYEKKVEVVDDVRKRTTPVIRNKVLTKKVKPIVDSVPPVAVKTEVSVIDAVVPAIPETIAEILPTKTIEKVIPEPIKEIIIPTIKPMFGDLSQGIVKLSGTGEPESNLQLLVNGKTSANIGIDKEGLWHYETILKPGDYSLQVLIPGMGETNKSPLSHITIPQLQPVVEVQKKVIEVKEEIKAVPIEIKQEVLPKEVEIKPEITSIIERAPDIQEPSRNENLYRVKYGDTLNKLSRRYNLTVRELATINNIADKDEISVGQMLIIPGQ